MRTWKDESAGTHRSNPPWEFSRLGGRFVWHLIRLPVFGLLVLLEPFVSVLLSGVAVLGLISAVVLEFSGAAPRFPFWGMISFSVGCVLTLVLYHAVLRFFSR